MEKGERKKMGVSKKCEIGRKVKEIICEKG